MSISRRAILSGMAAVVVGRSARQPVILLRSGWQTVNIGDIAHTPGALAVIYKHMPEAEVILWPNLLDRGVEPMLRRNFPRLGIVQKAEEIDVAFRKADLLIHGSAPSVTSQSQMDSWRNETGKPYGFFGIGFTIAGEAAGTALSPSLRETLSSSQFIYTRETASLANLRQVGITGPLLGFAPDGAFSMEIRNDRAADEFLKANGLEDRRFIALIPRLRYTPYHKIRPVSWSEAEIRRRTEANERHQEPDHAKLREVIAAWVRETGCKALVCPEMTYQLDIIGPLVYDPLPAQVKRSVVRRKTYWLPDEAASVYRRAVAVISFECHSPIIAAAQGTPCMYVHQPQDGIKGQMWKDIGLGDWYFEIDETSGAEISQRVLDIWAEFAKARKKVDEAVAYARRLQDDAMRHISALAGQAAGLRRRS